jgi:hypothetical protein
MFDP